MTQADRKGSSRQPGVATFRSPVPRSAGLGPAAGAGRRILPGLDAEAALERKVGVGCSAVAETETARPLHRAETEHG